MQGTFRNRLTKAVGALFAPLRRRAELDSPLRALSTEHGRRPSDAQLDLFR